MSSLYGEFRRYQAALLLQIHGPEQKLFSVGNLVADKDLVRQPEAVRSANPAPMAAIVHQS